MNDLRVEEIPPLLLHTVPESAESISERYQISAEAAVLTENAVLDLYGMLAECFTASVLIPQLESPNPDVELLKRCWGFVERIMDHSSQYVSGAVYFEVLEQLLNEGELLEAAWPYMKDRTRARTVQMLNSYGVFVPGINRR
ncbi:hypothetical protein AB0M23_06135 [Streptomyces sp. NPDC052077]|uniref:DUF7674 family protein n=1 Tax=Streptomyces sp. NPDC052077 TaxID=3154757 RepID=UPI003449831E